jgi:hypothetical protein
VNGSWPTVVLVYSKSDGGSLFDQQQQQQQQDGSSWSDQRQWPEADGVMEVDGNSSGRGSSSGNSSTTREGVLSQHLVTQASVSSPVHPVHTPGKLAQVQQQQQQQQPTQQDPQQQQQQQQLGSGVRSLKQLTSRVEQLTVASPAKDPQQQQQQHEEAPSQGKCLRRESQPVEASRPRATQPLRTALSVPLPAKAGSGRQVPLHPYMQYYQQQAHQQQQKQQQQRPQEAQAAHS